VCKLVENPCVGVIRSLSLTQSQKVMCIQLYLVWLSHTHIHTLRYTLDTSETTCILSLFTRNISLYVYIYMYYRGCVR
jgi:hypothetical protein